MKKKEDDINENNFIDFFKKENKNLENFIPNSKETKFYFGKIISLERMILLLSILSLFIGEYEFKNVNQASKEVLSKKVLYLLMFISLISGLLVIIKYIIMVRYSKVKKIIQIKKNFLPIEENFEYIFDFIVLLSHSSPFLYKYTFSYYSEILDKEIIYKVNSIFHFLSIMKIIVIFRIVLFNTMWASDKSFRICRMYGCKNDFMFIIRCLMKEKPILFVLYTLIAGILFFGGAVRIVEGANPSTDLNKSHDNLLNCYWEVIITMTTVGYGDMYPSTNPGRLIIVVCSIFGITVVSLMVVSITNTLEMNNIENKSYIVLKKLILKSKMEKHAGFMISILAKNLNIRKKTKGTNINSNLKELNRLKNLFIEHSNYFKFYRRVYKSIIDENIVEEIDRMNGILNEKLDIIKSLLLNPEEKDIKKIRQSHFKRKTQLKNEKKLTSNFKPRNLSSNKIINN